MANIDAPFGLRPVRHKNGLPYNGSGQLYYVPASDSTAIYVGDPVIVNGSADAAGIPGCIRATNAGGNYISGVVVGVMPLMGAGGTGRDATTYRAASTERYVMVEDSPDVIFEIQTTGTLAAADVSLNADLTGTGGSTVSGLSSTKLDTSTKATTNTLQLKILRVVQRPDQVLGDTNVRAEVMINLHTQRDLTGR